MVKRRGKGKDGRVVPSRKLTAMTSTPKGKGGRVFCRRITMTITTKMAVMVK